MVDNNTNVLAQIKFKTSFMKNKTFDKKTMKSGNIELVRSKSERINLSPVELKETNDQSIVP